MINSRNKKLVISKEVLLISILIMVCLLTLILVVDPIKYQIISAKNLGDDLISVVVRIVFDNIILLGGLLMIVLTLLVSLSFLEIKTKSCSYALLKINKLAINVLLVVVVAWFAQTYLYPGYLLPADTGSHMVRTMHTADEIRNGSLPFWNNYFYLGAPFLEFYAPLYYWLAGSAVVFTGSMEWGPKIFLLLMEFISAYAMYGFMRRIGASRFGALISALVYIGSWAHGHLLLHHGVLPLSLVMTLMPIMFWSSEVLIRSNRNIKKAWIVLAVSTGAIVASHQPHGVFAGFYLGLYVVARWFFMTERDWKVIVQIVIAGICGLLISIFAVYPHLMEQSWVISDAKGELPSIVLPTMESLKFLFMWSNSKAAVAPESSAYLGLSAVFLAVIAFIDALKRQRRGRVSYRWVFIVSGLFVLTFILQGQLVRNVMYILLFLAPLAGAGTDVFVRRFETIDKKIHENKNGLMSHGPFLVLIALMLDLGTTAIQPLARTDKNYLIEAGKYLEENYADKRVVFSNTRKGNVNHGGVQIETGPAGSLIQYHRVQTVSGPHNHAATPVHNFAFKILMQAEKELRETKNISNESLRRLASLNVSLIVNDAGTNIGFPDTYKQASKEEILGKIIRIKNPTPIIFSEKLQTIKVDQNLERPMLWREYFDKPNKQINELEVFNNYVFDSMDIDLVNRRAMVIPVREGTKIIGISNKKVFGELVINKYDVDSHSVSIEVQAPSDGWVQLAHPKYPAQELRHNGVIVDSKTSAFGFVVAPATVGKNEYQLKAIYTDTRIYSNIFSAVIFILVILFPFIFPGLFRASNPVDL